VIDVASGALTQLVDWKGAEFSATWVTDGNVYFTSDREAKLGDLWKVPPTGGTPVRVTSIGSVNSLVISFPARTELFANYIDEEGKPAYATLEQNGALRPIKVGGPANSMSIPSRGDSVAITVADEKIGIQAMIVPFKGGKARPILKPNEDIGPWSPDGKQMIYYVRGAGQSDIGIVDVASGAQRRLLTTPQNETGTEFTPDGKSIVFRRNQTVQRITTVDATKLLAPTR
jgi:TolB protein